MLSLIRFGTNNNGNVKDIVKAEQQINNNEVDEWTEVGNVKKHKHSFTRRVS